MSNKKIKEILIIVLGCVVIAIGSYYYFSYRTKDGFSLPIFRSKNKEVENYFIEKLGMPTEEAKKFAENEFSFYITRDTTLNTVISNLQDYGLIKDKEALKRTLEKTKDNLPGKPDALKIGNHTIDVNAYYQLKKGLTEQKIAEILLNNPIYLQGYQYNYIFMPNELSPGDQKVPDK